MDYYINFRGQVPKSVEANEAADAIGVLGVPIGTTKKTCRQIAHFWYFRATPTMYLGLLHGFFKH